MRLKSIELSGFKSFARKTELQFSSAITSIVGPNGSGKSNVAESFRFVLGEQSMKSMRGRRGEDMIWNGSGAVPRSNRASVRLVFDNRDRALNLDFDDVVLERVVMRDGSNEYRLNNSQVRLRDISELLSQANIGSPGHHIISQGEADRVLTASPKERRAMIEDALGLTAFLYKREEAERKLEKTAENMREVAGLRRELAPHLKFLQSQVRKIEDSKKLRDELEVKYKEYLKRESIYLSSVVRALATEGAQPREEHIELSGRVLELRLKLGEKQNDHGTSELMRLEQEGRNLLHKRDSLGRELGRIEGELVAVERVRVITHDTVPGEQVRTFMHRTLSELEESMSFTDDELKARVQALIILAKDFLRRISDVEEVEPRHSKDDLNRRKIELGQQLEAVTEDEARVVSEVATLRAAIEGEKDASREAERELFLAISRRSELETLLARLTSKQELLERDEAQFKRELGEAGVFIGRTVENYTDTILFASTGQLVSDEETAAEPRTVQEDRRRRIERMKIRLEEAGVGNTATILREHQETLERDEFLAREVADLQASTVSLRALIEDLSTTLSVRFVSGLEKINTEFTTFFMSMFGGGTATLTLAASTNMRKAAQEEVETDEEDEVEEGVDIAISLPHKRVKGLHMLSGGERALTSIALIFAMSQVNPPPFLILDETDAALDEANSRRYGNLIETLAKHSQLIVITHNRETMSRAGVLYGITMGSEGISKLLSIKFEDALAVAK